VALESVLRSADDSTVPNFAASLYGGPSDDLLAASVPNQNLPLFICAANDDQLKLAPKSILLYSKWHEANQPTELHIFEKGGHGLVWRRRIYQWINGTNCILIGWHFTTTYNQYWYEKNRF